MNAFNRIAEPALFVQQLYAHSLSIDQSVALTQPLTEALLAEDHERVWAVHEQIRRISLSAGNRHAKGPASGGKGRHGPGRRACLSASAGVPWQRRTSLPGLAA